MRGSPSEACRLRIRFPTLPPNGEMMGKMDMVYFGFLPHLGMAQTYTQTYPLVNKQFAIEKGPVEIVDLPSYKMVDLSIVFCMFTRG